MENIEYQNVPVSMSYLVPSMSQALVTSENNSLYSFHSLLDYDGLIPVNDGVNSHGLHGAEHSSMSSSSSSQSSLQVHSPVQWFAPTTLSGLCFLPSSPDAQLQHQQQPQQPLGQQEQQQKPPCHAHEQQMHPHQHDHSNNLYHHQQQLQLQQQYYQQQQAPIHYSLPPHNHTIQQQHRQLHLQQQQQQHLHSKKGIESPEMRSSSSSTCIRDISSPSMISLQNHYPTKALLNQPIILVEQLSMEFAAYRSVSFDRLSSPEAPSPVSEQGFFDMSTDDETASGCYSPLLLSDKMHLNSNSNNNKKNDTIAMEQLNISGSVPTSLPQRRKRTPPSLVHKSTPTATLEQIMLLSPHATAAALTAGPAMMSSSLSSSSSSSLSMMSALSSPLKQHFTFSTSLSDSDTRGGVKGSSSSSSPTSVAAAKKRRERKLARSGHKKPKHPPVKLPCQFPGCTTTCSSQPSLARHAEAHKWRGLYSPVRCEACQSALSNEFSVQRHIVRSQPNSRCHRLRVYSIMKSETEIETSVRFYPKRAHGKKTVEINLGDARARYLGDSPL